MSTQAGINLQPLFSLPQVIQILCGVMVLSLGVILAAAPASPYFTAHFSLLIDSACPFLGALCVSTEGEGCGDGRGVKGKALDSS